VANSCRTSFRKAVLSARRHLEDAQRLKRKALLASYAASAATSPQNRSGASTPAPTATSPSSTHQPSQQLFTARDRRRVQQQQREKQAGNGNGTDPTLAASSDVTEALRRTHALIADSLGRSEFARKTLDESTAALKSLDQSYSGLDDLLSSSRELLGVLLSSQKSDTWYLQTTLYMLLGTLAWLVFRRILYAPLWWLIWLPLRLVWTSGKAVTAIGSGSGGQSAGARMEVVNEGQSTRVVEINQEGAVPTISIGEPEEPDLGEPGSLLEDVAKLVEKRQGLHSEEDVIDQDLGQSEPETHAEAQGRTEPIRVQDEL
jgi:protein transport protein SEC20